MKKLLSLFFVSFLFLLAFTAHAQPQIPTGRTITLPEILTLFQSLGGFLYALGSILAVITIIISGFSYLLAGGDQTKVKKAKDILKVGIIGALVIFSAGLIVNTVSTFSSDPFQFFGGSGGGGGGNNLPNGSVCSSGNDCISRYCNLNLNPSICQ